MKEFFPAETVTGERAVEHVGRCMRVCVKCVLNVLLVEVRTPLQQKGWLYPVMITMDHERQQRIQFAQQLIHQPA